MSFVKWKEDAELFQGVSSQTFLKILVDLNFELLSKKKLCSLFSWNTFQLHTDPCIFFLRLTSPTFEAILYE